MSQVKQNQKRREDISNRMDNIQKNQGKWTNGKFKKESFELIKKLKKQNRYIDVTQKKYVKKMITEWIYKCFAEIENEPSYLARTKKREAYDQKKWLIMECIKHNIFPNNILETEKILTPDFIY